MKVLIIGVDGYRGWPIMPKVSWRPDSGAARDLVSDSASGANGANGKVGAGSLSKESRR